MAAPAVLFTSQARVARLLSTPGLLSRTDGDGSGSIDGTISAVAWARSTATITATRTSHGLLAGDTITISASSDLSAIPLGIYTIVSADSDTFTFTGVAAGGASGTLSYQGSNETALMNDAINFGTLEVCKYIQRRYLPALLANSELACYFATVFAACYLCEHAGNLVPESLAEKADQIISQLIEIRDGSLDIPDVPEKAPRGPGVINLRADARFNRPMRRQDNQSTPRGHKSTIGQDYADMIPETR